MIQLNRKKRMVVEVKAIQLDLSEKHLRQSVNYAANEGIEWICLTNGSTIELYRVIFGKPIEVKLVTKVDLSDLNDIKSNLELLYSLTKKAMVKDELETYWNRFKALDPKKLAEIVYSEDIVRLVRRLLKKDVGLNFSEQDIKVALLNMIRSNIDKTPGTSKRKPRKKK